MKQIVAKRKDVVFFLKMYPILQLHPQAYAKSKTIVCEESNEKALLLLEDVYAGRTIAKPSCNTNVIDENIALGNKLSVNGTPTLIFNDGVKVSGAMSESALIKLIDLHKETTKME
jgi:thiol:disulfide interchange protein DsbC